MSGKKGMHHRKRKPTDIGRGFLRCHICGERLRDHPIGRCPTADVYDPDAFKGPMTNRGRRRDSEQQTAKQTGR